jgi:hypothetical protein
MKRIYFRRPCVHTLTMRTLLTWATWATIAGPAAAFEPAACESLTPRNERREITCALKTPTSTQRLRFKAHFSGSHDDTTAAMNLTLDGAPLACEPGSKTYLEAEDGDVALECRFSIAPGSGAKRSVRALISWHHAEYTRFELVTE